MSMLDERLRGTGTRPGPGGALVAAGIVPPSPAQTPLRPPPVLSLIAASRTLAGDTQPLTGDPVRWEGGGVEFQPLPCQPRFDPLPPGCDTHDLGGTRRQGSLRFEPVDLWAGVKCSLLSWDPAEAGQRARDLLAVDQHRQLEAEFWTGEVADAEAMPNLWLAMDGTVVELEAGAPVGLTEALTRLQQEIADTIGGRGMIHATVRTAGLWFSTGRLRRQGNLLLDAFDNIVVPGVGYPGSAPDGTVDSTGNTAWAYATGIVDTRLGGVFVPEAPAGVVNRADNNVEVRAHRQALAYWDGCTHAGINVNHVTTDIAGAGGSDGGDVDGGSP